MDQEMLQKKVDNVRMDIIKYLNGGETPELLFGTINMKKTADKSFEDLKAEMEQE